MADNGTGHIGDWTSLKAWASAIGVVGIPGAIAVIVVIIGATELPKLSRQLTVLQQEVQQNREVMRELTELHHTLIRIAQRACSNAAGKDENARQRCFDK